MNNRYFLRIVVILSFVSPKWLFGDIGINGNPPTMVISSATAGSNPASVSDSSTTYSILTLIVGSKITGAINSNMPTGTTLMVQLAVPLGASSSGNVTMSTVNTNLITSIPIIAVALNLSITYTFTATAAAAPVTNATKILTLTIQ